MLGQWSRWQFLWSFQYFDLQKPGSSVVGERLHLLWVGLWPPICLGSQHWRVRRHDWGRQVHQLRHPIWHETSHKSSPYDIWHPIWTPHMPKRVYVYKTIHMLDNICSSGTWSTVCNLIQLSPWSPHRASTTMLRWLSTYRLKLTLD